MPDFATVLDDDFGHDLLRLVFISCHRVLPTETRVALTVRLLGGLTTGEIARGWHVLRARISDGTSSLTPLQAHAKMSLQRPRVRVLVRKLSN